MGANEKEDIPGDEDLDKNAQLILRQIRESQQFIKTKENEKNDISLQFAKDIDRFNKLIKPDHAQIRVQDAFSSNG